MTRFLLRRAFWTAAVVAAAVGSLTLTPRQATSAWTIGDPIVTYWAGPGYDGSVPLTDAVAEQMVDVGMNVVWAASEAEVDLAGQHGLRALYQNRAVLLPENLDDPMMRAALDATVDGLRNNPALYGYHVRDEPSAAEFSGLGQLVDYLRERDPDHLARINLFPIGPAPATLGAPNYDTYVNQFVSTVQPALLSYDHYSFTTTGDEGGYLQNLGIISQKAKSAGIPFMNIVQAAGWGNMRIPTNNEERFLAYTTLAYGAQGICYYTWSTWAPDPEIQGGIVNSDGTPNYSTIKSTNQEFVAIAKQYQPLNSIGTYLKGYSSGHLPPGTTLLPGDSPFDITSVSNNRTYNHWDPLKGVLLGLFDEDGATVADATYALLVNLDYTASKTYTVTGSENLSVFDATTGVWTATGHNYATLDLLPGGGKLVGFTSVVPVPEPSAIALLGGGLFCLLARAWWKGLPNRPLVTIPPQYSQPD